MAQLVKRGSLSVTSAHVVLDISAAGQTITSSGDETLDRGTLTALHLRETLPGSAGIVELVVYGGRTYGSLPDKLNPFGKPWVFLPPGSQNPTIQMLAESASRITFAASIGSVSAFVDAAQNVTKERSATINGVHATHFAVIVDSAKLHADTAVIKALEQAGVTSFPVDLYIDDEGRPLHMSEKLAANGAQVSTTITITKYNQPVTITAPPADQVAG